MTKGDRGYRKPGRPTSRPNPGRACGKTALMLPFLIPLGLYRTWKMRRST